MISMEERLNYLDSIMAELAHAQMRTEIYLKASAERADRNAERLEASLDRSIAEMKEDTRRMKQAWGDLANKMGTVAEDVVARSEPLQQ